jgi:hypothetical protein
VLVTDKNDWKCISTTWTMKSLLGKHVTTMKFRLHVQKWKYRDTNKLLTPLGVLIFQGVALKPENKMHTSKCESTATPFFNSVMSQKWYHLLPEISILCEQRKFQ